MSNPYLSQSELDYQTENDFYAEERHERRSLSVFSVYEGEVSNG